ncbi:hypothetical protein [Solidesulfovibrio magneticus]|uniref:Uncharacterized protein n=1 Tax=Solidesulfovibrio magneticus (strain ATCC 700980 / DSM 13731 / RS-1) TaxID=573370 RepID=C4XTJ7_SOLM1|nr:hypothetical protein [Solidesulfovibrio magneticus]BAH75994.1 hypothetical protein DMR_25030 [Solidesulfovibrio magneticus RS-1]
MANTNDASAAATAGATETRYRVVINPEKGPGGGSNIDLFVNGFRCSLERGRELQLTAAQLEVLENAETQGYSMEIAGEMHVAPSVKRYSYYVRGTVEVPLAVASPEAADPASGGEHTGGNGFAAP